MTQKPTKGAGTLVWARKAPVCDRAALTTPTIADTAAAVALFEAQGFKQIGCAYTLKPPGYDYDTVEDEPCLGDGEGTPFVAARPEGFQIGDVVQVGKKCWKALATNLSNEGTVNTPMVAPPDPEYWEETDCGCAYPNVELGTQQVNEMAASIGFCPGGNWTEQFANACACQWQFIYQYPRKILVEGNGFVCRSCAHTFCGRIKTWDPDDIDPTSLMKASMTIVRTTPFDLFCWDDPA